MQGIGGRQLIGPKKQYNIRFSSDKSQIYKVWLHKTNLSTNQEMVILGRDFLNQFSSTEFDWKNSKVRLGEKWIFLLSADKGGHDINPNLPSEAIEKLHGILESFPGVFAKNPRAPRCSSATTHEIKSIDDRPIKNKIRRIPAKWSKEVDTQVTEMIEHDIIEPSSSPFNSNPLLVSKEDNSKRFVVDFRLVNRNTVQDTYPLPTVEELVDEAFGCTFFSQLDLASGYWTVPISESHRHKTAFSIPRGKYQFKRMPFGLKNAQATFQRCMDKIVEECKEKGAVGLDAYVDNLIVCSTSMEEHINTLEILLQVLESNNMSLRKDKCEFAYQEIQFLGFKIDGKTLKPGTKNISKIKEFPAPTTRKQLQSFLGLANYNRRFIDGYSVICSPLNRLTSSKVPFVWTSQEQAAFDKLKTTFHAALSLFIPDWSKPFVIRTDASKIAVGSVLGQYDENGSFKPVGYHSETLNQKNTKNWSATERELYGIISASRKWKTFCYEKITFYSDHEPLRNIHRQKDPRGKIGRWILELENLDYCIKYLKGADNQEADYLSRIMGSDAPSEDPSVFVLGENLLRDAQIRDKDMAEAIETLRQDKIVNKGLFRQFLNLKVTNNLLCKGSRVIVPQEIAPKIIQEYHGQGHPGIDNTCLMLSERFYWRGMRKQVESFVSNCRTCTQCKHGPKPKAPVQDHREVEKIFEMISMDLASMPVSRRGNGSFLLVTDIFTKLMTAIPLTNSRAETIVDALWCRWFGYYGLPKLLQSDQGSNVDGTKVRQLCEELAIKKLRSSAYHPAGNGSAERAIGSLKTILRSMCLSRGIPITQWDELLPEAILMFNNTQNKSSKFSPFEAAYGVSANLPLDNKLGVNQREAQDPQLVRQNIPLNKHDSRLSYQKQANKTTNVNKYQVGDWVLLRRNHGEYPKMHPIWDEMFQISKKIGTSCWGIVNFVSGKSKIVHHDQIKPAGTKQDASMVMGSSAPVQNPHAPVGRVLVDNSLPQHNLPQMDRQQFANNVFNMPTSAVFSPSAPQPAPSSPPIQPSTTTTTRSGRVVRPPTRLIDQL